MKRIIQNFRRIYEKYSFMGKTICILTIIYALGISAIIRANYNYIDDLGRVRYGYRSWENFSRYISSYLSIFIHADTYLTDISPLPQLLAVVLLALSGSVILFILTEKQNFSVWNTIAMVPLGLSPYFLECLSYKYDSPYMALSILASVLPLLFCECSLFIYAIVTILCILVMCTTYQAASGIYPMLIVLLSFNQWNKGKNIKAILRFLGTSFINYLSALLIFKIFIMKTVDDYVSNSIAPMNQIVPQLMKYFSYIGSDFKKWWLLLIGITALFYIFVSVRNSLRKKWHAFLLAVLTLLIMGALSFGMYPVLKIPLYVPRAMYGFGVLIALIGVSVMNAEKVYPAKVAYLYLCWIFFAFSFTYGNALAEQYRYTNFRVNAVIEDMNDLDIFNSEDMKTVQILGNIGKSPIIRQQPQSYQILNRLVPDTFGRGWVWSEYYFYEYFDFKNTTSDYSIDLTAYDLPIIRDTMYHTIRGNEGYILIELK